MGSSVFVVVCRNLLFLLVGGMQTHSCSVWDLSPPPEIKHSPTELGVWSPSHWTTVKSLNDDDFSILLIHGTITIVNLRAGRKVLKEFKKEDSLNHLV